MKRSGFKRKPPKFNVRRTRLAKVRDWGTRYADSLFSKHIRTRDPMCRRCWVVPSDDNSHFWGRGHSATRFDPKNCIGLCRPCHDIWEHQKNNEYRKFMVNWLGKEEYEALEHRARSFKKRSDAVRECMVFLKEVKNEKTG